MELNHGTREEHPGTLRRAKANGVGSVWSGDPGRNAYLRENLAFAEEEGILSPEPYDDPVGQKSGLVFRWLREDF